MTQEELDYIQSVFRKWLQQPGGPTGNRIVIPSTGPLSHPVEIELKGLLTFHNVRHTFFVDAETGACYAHLIEQPDGISAFFNTPLEKLSQASVLTTTSDPAPMRATQKRYRDAMQRLVEERSEANTPSLVVDPNPWWIEKGTPETDEHPKYQLYTDGKLLGHSLLERKDPDGQRRGRFHASQDYFEYANIFAELTEAENECMETNAREAYGIADEESDTVRTRFNELSTQVAALNLYLFNEAGTRIDASKIKLEDLSTYYNDPAERWLQVVIEAKPDEG